MPHFYRVFDLLLESSIAFPGTSLARPGKSDVVVLKCALKDMKTGEFSLYHRWETPNGQLAIEGARRGGDYLLRFPRLADFELSAALDRIQMGCYPGTGLTTLRHLLLDHVLPRLLNQRGRLVVHASAVEFPDGTSVVFVGNSGKGKSTLAASFRAAGCEILADDSVILDCSGQTVTCIPAYPSLRLWPDSHERLFAGCNEFSTVSHYSQKRQLLLDSSRNQSGPMAKLGALFLLGNHDETRIRIEPAFGSAGLMAIVESVFALDPSDAEVVQRNLLAASRLMSSGLPIFHLHYQRDYALLPAVREHVVQVVDHVRRAAKTGEPVYPVR